MKDAVLKQLKIMKAAHKFKKLIETKIHEELRLTLLKTVVKNTEIQIYLSTDIFYGKKHFIASIIRFHSFLFGSLNLYENDRSIHKF